MNFIVIAILVLGSIALVAALVLFGVSKKFAVEEDPRLGQVGEILPGANCGGCGFAGCDALAKAIAAGDAPVGACPVGGQPVADKIASIMGVEADAGEKQVAFVKCAGTCEKAKQAYDYTGITDCQMAAMMQNGGPKGCSFGCLGFGSCVKACPFDAIHIVDGIALVDKEVWPMPSYGDLIFEV